MKNRINRVMVCSSDHYSESKRAHRALLNEYHSTFVELDIQVTIKVVHHYYAPCFDKLIEISEEMALRRINRKEPVIIK